MSHELYRSRWSKGLNMEMRMGVGRTVMGMHSQDDSKMSWKVSSRGSLEKGRMRGELDG